VVGHRKAPEGPETDVHPAAAGQDRRRKEIGAGRHRGRDRNARAWRRRVGIVHTWAMPAHALKETIINACSTRSDADRLPHRAVEAAVGPPSGNRRFVSHVAAASGGARPSDASNSGVSRGRRRAHRVSGQGRRWPYHPSARGSPIAVNTAQRIAPSAELPHHSLRRCR
jgi:hypothetical protein